MEENRQSRRKVLNAFLAGMMTSISGAGVARLHPMAKLSERNDEADGRDRHVETRFFVKSMDDLIDSYYEPTDPSFSAAFRRAAAKGISPMLQPNKTYPCNEPTGWESEDIVPWSPTLGRIQGGARITTTLRNGALFIIAGANSGFHNLSIVGPGYASGLEYLIKLERKASQPPDLDFSLTGVLVSGALTGVLCRGRGLLVDDKSSFADNGTHLAIDSGKNAASSSEFGSSLQGGARKYRIHAYFHNAAHRSIDVLSPLVQGMLISGCYHDDAQQFFRGYANDAIIEGNSLTRMGQVFRHDTDAFSILGSRNSQIGRNLISGDSYDAVQKIPGANGLPLRRLRRGIYVAEGKHVGLKVADNIIFGSMREAILVEAGAALSSFEFSQNILRYVCLENDTAIRSPIAILGELTRGRIVGNILDIPSMANNAQTALLRRYGGKWTEVEYYGNIPSGGMPALAGTPTAGALQQLDEHNWVWSTSAGKSMRSASYPSVGDPEN
jgi:hypothetical protein